MDKLKAMHTFVQIVDSGSLTAAAGALETSLTSVVRQLSALEGDLSLRLLKRTTRRIALTDEGRAYYERCKRWVQEIGEFEASLSDREHLPQGKLRLTAPVMFGRMHVCPLVTGYLNLHPGMQAEVLLLDRVVDLIEEDVDMAVRIGELPDSTLIAQPLGSTRQVICASPAFIARHGTPQHPADLKNRPALRRTGGSDTLEWRFQKNADKCKVRLAEAFATNHVEPLIDACCSGAGYGRFYGYQTALLEAQGRLVRVLAEWEAEATPVHLVYPYTRLLSPRVRTFVDWAAPRLRQRLVSTPVR